MPCKIFCKIVAVVGAETYNHAAREHLCRARCPGDGGGVVLSSLPAMSDDALVAAVLVVPALAIDGAVAAAVTRAQVQHVCVHRVVHHGLILELLKQNKFIYIAQFELFFFEF